MLLARGDDTEQNPVIVIGLDQLDLDQLHNGKNLSFNLDQMNLLGSVVVYTGTNRDDLVAQLVATSESDGTKLHVQEDTPSFARRPSLKRNGEAR